jgi:YidC/Oxa1 family membrane protein insertase
MLLILAYQLFYYMPRMKAVEEARRAQQAELAREWPAAGDTLSRAPSTPDTLTMDDRSVETPRAADLDETGLPVAEPGAPARRVTVRTARFEMVLSTSGADIESLRLLKFETAGQPVDLVAQDVLGEADGVAEVALLTETGQIPLARVSFDAFSSRSTMALEDGAVLTTSPDRPEVTIVFRASAENAGGVERYYTVTDDSYLIRTGVRFRAAELPSVRMVRWGLGPGMEPTEANEQEDLAALRAALRLGDEYYRKRGSFDESYSGTVHWVSLQIKYFIVALMTPTPTAGEARLQGRKNDGFATASIALPVADRQGRVEQDVEMYMGPIDFDALKSFGRGLEKNVDLGHKIFRPVSAVVLWSLVKLHGIIPNYGLVIILLSVFTKVLFYRLTHKSFKSMRDMQALQPRIQALKEKYKEDRQKLSQETMKLYKEAGVNPLGGCLPMVLQMPVFIALFNVLRNTIELRQAPFLGWINDLSQQDVLARLPMSLPLVGDAVSVLPILMGASMLMQSKIGGSIAGPESSPSQSKAFQYMLPVVFTVLFYRMPSGLVVYWIVNTVLSVGQQYYINKGVEKAERAKSENQGADTSAPRAETKKTKRAKSKA